MAYELILQAYGWDRGWEVITTLGANVRNFAAGGSQAPKDVAVGEVAYGLAIDFYAWAQVAAVGSEYVGFTMPDNLTIVNPDGIGILRGAPNLEAARLFLHFVMSEPGQKLWFLRKGVPGGPVSDQLNRFTVLPDLYREHSDDAAVKVNPFEWRSELVYNSAVGGGRWSVVNDLIGVLVIDSHHDLRRAWREAMEDGVTEQEVRRLSSVPVSEEQALGLAESWRSPEFRSRTLADWTTFARTKYGARSRPLSARALDYFTLLFPVGIGCAMVFYLWRMRGA